MFGARRLLSSSSLFFSPKTQSFPLSQLSPFSLSRSCLSTTTPLFQQEKEKEKEKYYITTAINYANGDPHMGHAYEIVLADVMARYHRLAGRDVLFVTGSDDHGQKIARAAEKANTTPQEYTDSIVDRFKNLNNMLNISNDKYIRTSSPEHSLTAQKIWETMVEKGDIYKGTYRGWYNVREESFVADLQAKKDNFKDPVSGDPLMEMDEESYFFRMSKYVDQVKEHVNKKDTVLPASQKAEVLSRLENEQEVGDLSISRASFSWGIPVPQSQEEEQHVMYVWFEALMNYLTGVNYSPSSPSLPPHWPPNMQIIGQDITWFHSVILPCMLLSLSLPLPQTVGVHGFVVGGDERKMSKSLGNVVDPVEVLTKFGADAFRLFVLVDSSFGGDLRWSQEALVARHNAELGNTVGNLVNRLCHLVTKDNNGVVPSQRVSSSSPSSPPPFDLEALKEGVEKAFVGCNPQQALSLVLGCARDTNKWLTDMQPWKVKDKEEKLAIIGTGVDAIYTLSHFLVPFFPDGMERAFKNNFGEAHSSFSSLSPSFDNLAAGRQVQIGKLLYEPIVKETSPLVKLDLRVGEIIEVNDHPNADKLYHMQVNLGQDKPSSIVAGLKGEIEKETLLNKKVIVVANLKKTKLRGVVSEGMVLACSSPTKGGVQLVEIGEGEEGGKVGERCEIDGFMEDGGGGKKAISVGGFGGVGLVSGLGGRVCVGGKRVVTEGGVELRVGVEDGVEVR